MGTTLVPPLGSRGLTTTELALGGFPPPGGLSGFTTTRGGSGGWGYPSVGSVVALTTTIVGVDQGRVRPPKRIDRFNHNQGGFGGELYFLCFLCFSLLFPLLFL